MALSNDLVKQFAKITNDNKTTNGETTVYGTTVMYDGSIYVKVDGSDLLTPVETTTSMGVGERVMVMIKNHSATVTGNITDPSASAGKVEQVENTTKENASKISKFEIIVSDKVTTEELEAVNATIASLKATTAKFDNMEAVNADIDNLAAKYAELEYVKAEDVEALNAIIENLEVEFGKFSDISTEDLEAFNADITNLKSYNAEFTYVSADVLSAIKADIKTLDAENVKVSGKLTATEAEIEKLKAKDVEIDGKLVAAFADIDNLEADYVTVNGKLTATEADIITLKATKLDADVADITYATIDGLKATEADIITLKATKLDADVADITYATIGSLKAAEGRINTLETNSLTADSAVITMLKSDIADIDTLIFGTAGGNSIQTSFANAVVAQLGDAQIKSAMIESMSASKITAGDIITNNVRVKSEDGSLLISDETIQISDDAIVRVQIGKDAAGDYSINIWDSDGNLMFSEGGITDSAIKEAIIRDDMVSQNANIAASKLNIDSLFTEINGSTNTIKSSKVYLDDKNQTLDVAFTAMSSTISDLSSTQTSQGTAISVIQGQISSKVWQTDITTAVGEVDSKTEVLTTQYSELNQDLDELTATVASHTTQIASKADGSTVTTLTSKVTNIETDLSGFKSTVSTTYATKSNLSSEISNVNSKIDQTAETINLSVSNTYNKITSKGEQLIVNGNGMVGDNTNFSSWIFDGAVTKDSPGSFTRALGSGRIDIKSDEYFLISSNNEYEFALDAKSLLGLGTMYSFIMFYDADKNAISAGNHMFHPGSTTTLAKDLKSGDTVIYLTDTSGWSTSVGYGFYMSFWNYTNSFGYTYPAETYTRNRISLPKTSSNTLDSACINKTSHTIKLTTAYSGATVPAGTPVSQGRDGGTYKYLPLSNTVIPTSWTRYKGVISGVDYTGNNVAGKFPPGVSYGRIGFLWNYNNASGEQQWITNITVSDTTGISDALETAKNYTDTEIEPINTTVTEHSSQLSDHESRITVNENNILLRVTTTDFNTYKTTVTTNIANAKSEAISAAATDATSKANSALSNAKAYTVQEITTVNNSLSATNQEISIMKGEIALKVEQSDIDTAVTTVKKYTDDAVDTVETKVTTLSNTVASHTTSINSISSRVSSTETNISSVTTRLDNLDVGGRNYIVSSKLSSYSPYNSTPVANGNVITTTRNTSATGNTYLTLQINGYMPPNEYMTLSGYVMVNGAIPTTDFFKSRPSTYGSDEISHIYDPETGYFECTQKYPGNSGWIIHAQTGVTAGQADVITFTNLKFEKGTVATDWTPAPEDIEAAINATNTEVANVKSTVAEHTTGLSSITSRVETTEKNITTINGEIDSVESRVSAAELKITDSAIISTVSGTYATKTALAATDTKATNANNYVSNAQNNYGYQYKYDITLNGDAATYYPVVFRGGNQNVMREIFITRSYSEKAPTEWDGHGSTKGISLLLKIKCNFGGWGGANYSWTIMELEEMYGNLFASAGWNMSYMAFEVFLRGGGTTGAIYHIYSDQELEVTWMGGTSPAVYYNKEQIGNSGTTYVWNASAPRTLTDSIKAEINGHKYASEGDLTKAETRIAQTENAISLHATSISDHGTRLSALELSDTQIKASVADCATKTELTQTSNSLTVQISNAQSTANNAKLIADAGSKRINTHMRSFTKANWETYGTAGHSESWTTGSSYDNSHISVGDIAYIVGTVSDASGSNTVSAMLYGTVTSMSTSSIVMTTLYYVMGGEGGAYAAASAAQSTANTAVSNAATAQSTANTANTTANSVKNDLANNYAKKTLPDTRNDNQTPEWYIANYPQQVITEFKYTSVIGLSGETYCALETVVPWPNTSGGYPKQVAKVGGKEYWRIGTSNTAWGTWNDASATATNYLNFSSSGLVIGDMTASTLGRNILIDINSVDIRNGTTVLASYQEDAIYLGMNADVASIYLCGNSPETAAAQLWNDASDDEWYRLCMYSPNAISLSTNGLISHTVASTPDYGATEYLAEITVMTKAPWMSSYDDSKHYPRISMCTSKTSVDGSSYSSNAFFDMGETFIEMSCFNSESGNSSSLSMTSECIEFDSTGFFRIDCHTSVGKKNAYCDGKDGVFISTEGFMQIQRSVEGYHPYIGFYLNGSTSTADGMIRVNQSNGYMEFTNSGRYIFDTFIYTPQGIRFGCDDTASSLSTRAITTIWKDGSSHNIVERNSNGLLSAFGWAGSEDYATITRIRGRTCQYQNSSGTTALSDERLKYDFRELDEWDSWFNSLKPWAFKMKTGNSGRYHFGFSAQQVEEALVANGKTSKDFAGYIKMDYLPDEDDPERTAIYEAAGIREGDVELGLIYTEFTAMNTWQIQKLKAEVKALKEKIAELKKVS